MLFLAACDNPIQFAPISQCNDMRSFDETMGPDVDPEESWVRIVVRSSIGPCLQKTLVFGHRTKNVNHAGFALRHALRVSVEWCGPCAEAWLCATMQRTIASVREVHFADTMPYR